MADTKELNRTLQLRSRRPLYGWREVSMACYDDRLYFLRSRSGEWFFAVLTDFRWQCTDGQTFDHREGPFTTEKQAWAVARHWFLDNPAGATAELLARHPHEPLFYQILQTIHEEADKTSVCALHDLAEAAGISQILMERVERQLYFLGISGHLSLESDHE
jgi:hypothetical protein